MIFSLEMDGEKSYSSNHHKKRDTTTAGGNTLLATDDGSRRQANRTLTGQIWYLVSC